VKNQLRSELRKITTIRTIALVLLGAAALTAVGVLFDGASSPARELAGVDEQRRLLGGGSVVVFFVTVAGALLVTSEFRYGTIRPTLLFEPRRRIVLAAKLIAGALAGVVFGAVCLGASFTAGLVLFNARGVDVVVTGADALELIVGTLAACVLGAILGVAVGTLIRSQVGAVLALVAYAFVLDAGIFRAEPSLGRYLPGKASDAVAGQNVEDLLAPGIAVAVLLAWALAFVVAATVRSDRADV
jgi:ABC-type transport system involved in multi-copper enzyme maturation permease subunit